MALIYVGVLNMATDGGFYEEFSFYLDGEPCAEARCVLSLRAAGQMGFAETAETPPRRALFAALGLAAGRAASCRQSHSTQVALVNADDPSSVYEADALVGCGGAALSVTVADCLPVYLFDTRTKAFALCHSGWKGTGIALEALRLMRAHYGTRPRDVAAVLGPCIQRCCYRVDAGRAASFQRAFGQRDGTYPAGKPVVEEKAADGGTAYFLDMQAANAKLLYDEGVRSLSRQNGCTFTDERYGSFRREGTAFTKMAAILFRP